MPSAGLLYLAAAAIAGTLAVAPLASDVRPVELIALVAAATITIFGRQSARFRSAVIATLVLFAAHAAIAQRDVRDVVPRRTARYAATLVERRAQTDGSTSVTLALNDGTMLSARLRGDLPAPGAQLIIRGRLEPFDGARNPGEPSERDIERERGLDAQMEAADVIAVRAAGSSFDSVLARAHEWAHAQLQTRLGEPAASVVAGELWGERSALPPALRAEFQETGTVHILVTAGLHMGAVTALILTMLLAMGLPRSVTCTLAIAALWCFVWWSGAQLPAERAATMATAALAARACGRASFSWHALALAAIVVAWLRPLSVGTASFALSFSCVGAIFACAGPIDRWLEVRIALPERIREALTLTLATQLGTWPIGAAVFLQFAPYAAVANFAIVPCVAITMALGVAQLGLFCFAPLAQMVANLNSWPIAWMLGVVQTVSALPFAVLPMTPPPAWCVALYDAALLATPLLWNRNGKTLAASALLLAVVLVLWPPRLNDSHLRITVLDVGQADAIVIQTPRGHALLVDAGGRLERGGRGEDSVAEEVGERTVVPFLLRHGIHAVDALILSHPHGDHAGGVAPVLRRLRVGQFDDGGQRYAGHAYQDALATANVDGVPMVYPRAGTRWRTDDGVALTFIGPSLPFIGGRNAINSNSVAFVLQYGSFRMLFTGDAGSEAEERFLAENVDLHAAVLKVGHHGSAYGSSPAFISAVHPQYAIISVGRHNLFGHPAPSTLQTLRRFGATVYRTDENAAVIVDSDGRSFTVTPML
jgi:competence protein ComEC